jgi:hypothetical protein
LCQHPDKHRKLDSCCFEGRQRSLSTTNTRERWIWRLAVNARGLEELPEPSVRPCLGQDIPGAPHFRSSQPRTETPLQQASQQLRPSVPWHVCIRNACNVKPACGRPRRQLFELKNIELIRD